jgi:hypothetical protein
MCFSVSNRPATYFLLDTTTLYNLALESTGIFVVGINCGVQPSSIIAIAHVVEN